MIRFPNAKINFGLHVLSKRSDGFHDLETVFFPLPLQDCLEFVTAKKEGSLTNYGLEIDCDKKENNLIWKAWQLLKNDFPTHVFPLDFYVLKKIPSGAGLGGGPADAAFALKMMNQFFKLQLTLEQLEKYALSLGSDCPFFIKNQCAFAEGRGEILTPIALNLSAYSLQLICPEIHVSTRLAFSNIKLSKKDFSLKNLPDLPLAEWKNFVRNDFEETIFNVYPDIAQIKNQLYQHGALYAGMSGTGSSVFGIFPKNKKAVLKLDTAFSSFYFDRL